ncbi:MAG: alpha/beta hydrolase [Alphaproteobacteria bacterium]|nr:MAG: alpha/beta hydrolase [Alphaproteobacteria bacterium]
MKTRSKAFLVLPLILLLCSCSGEKLLNAFVPKTGYRIYKDIAYGSDPRQEMDIYVPDGLKRPVCTVLFFYGGRWTDGDRGLYRFAGEALSSKGCVTAIADYRVYPKIRYPVFMEDSAKAFVFLHRHAAEYGGDPERLYLAGHSAGAYNAVMLAVHPTFLKNAGGQPAWVRGVIGISGPYDFLPFTDADVIDIFSTETGAATQPITYVRKGLPPMLLVTGDADTEVKPKNTRNMAAKLQEAGNPVTVRIYPGIYHEAMVLSLLHGFRGKTPLLHDIATFIKEHP